MKKKPVEKFIDFFSKIKRDVVKYSSVCVGPYIKDVRRKYTKKGNNSEDNNKEGTTNEKATSKKKDVLRNLYCTKCYFITKYNPASNSHGVFLHYFKEHDIKIEDQIWPNLPRLAKVFNIQSSGAVNLKILIAFYIGDSTSNPIIRKFFKFWNRDVSSTPSDHLNDFFRKTLS